MKVGFLIYGDIESMSGGYLYDRKLVSYLRRQGDNVDIISLTQRAYLNNMLDNVKPSPLPHLDVDILVQDELVHPSVFWANRRVKGERRVPIVGLVHLISASAPHGPFEARLRRLAERGYLRSVDGLIFNSTHSRDQARALLGTGLPSHAIAVPAGDNFDDLADAEEIARPVQAESGPLRLIFVGNVIRQKGLEVLVRCLSGLERSEFELTVAGRTDMEPAYVKSVRDLVRRKGLDDRVTFRGPLGLADLGAAYRASDVLVVPSVNEAYGIVYVEAQQFGLPVIGTTAGGAKEIVRQGETGFMIAPGDAAQLAHTLTRLHQDRALLAKMSRAALNAFHQHPTWDESCGKIRQFLVDMISKQAPAQ